MKSRLAMSGRQHRQLQDHLFPGDGLESVAILICGRGRGDRDQLIVRRIIEVPHSAVFIRERDRLEWPASDYLLPLVEELERDDLGVVVIHCHPQGGPFFSDADDAGDHILFPSIHSWFDEGGKHGAAVMIPGGAMIARFVDGDGIFEPIDVVSVAGDDIQVFRPPDPAAEVPEHARRIAQTFGRATYEQLRQLRVAVVGCSGTGSIVIELLARNCAGTLVLVDDDRVEAKNLNRIVNSTTADAEAGLYKVDVLAKAVRSFGLGTTVEVYAATLANDVAARAVATCDIVFGCVDTVTGRHVLNGLCSAYSLPLFDLGVEITPDGEGSLSHAVAHVHYIQPEGSSLLSREAYTIAELTAEDWKANDPAYYEEQRVAGYLRAVQEDRPAVMPVNMMASNGAVIDMLARLHPFRLDPNSAFAIQHWNITHGYYESFGDGVPCALMQRLVGLADKWSSLC
jgi:hypothetical protein